MDGNGDLIVQGKNMRFNGTYTKNPDGSYTKTVDGVDLLEMNVNEPLFVAFLINIEDGDGPWKVHYGPRGPDDGGARINSPNAEPVKLTRFLVDGKDEWVIETLTGTEGSAKAALTLRGTDENGDRIHDVQNYYDMPFRLVLTRLLDEG